MKTRSRFLIMAAIVCHVLLRPPLVTSQLRSPESQRIPDVSPSQISLPALPHSYQNMSWSSITQELNGAVVKLSGEAEIHYGAFVLHADEMMFNRETGEATVDGHVVLDGGANDEHITASRGNYNIHSEVGKFENVHGTIGMRVKGARLILTSDSPFVLSGKTVEKTGPDHYLVFDGTITTCELPRPKWQFYAHRVVVEVGGNASIYRSTFRIGGIPILYLPYATHPIERSPRRSGFLVPNIGRSSTKGNMLGESVFWAINRSMDMTLGAEYFSTRGWAPQGNFRARPTETSFVDLTFFSVLDRGIRGVDQGGAEVRLNAEDAFAHNFRGVANIDYLSSFVFRLAFNDVFAQAVNSEVKSDAFLSNTTRGYFYNGSVRRYQNFESTTLGDYITIFHAPTLELSSVDHQIWRSPFYWSYDGSAGALSRTEPGFHTAPSVGRFDAAPNVALPLRFHGWTVRPEVEVRNTIYTEQLLPFGEVGTPKSSVIDRKAFGGSVELRPPSIEKVFEREALGRKWKHVIEPWVIYDYEAGVKNFSRIVRFDERDVLSATNEVEYSVTNRLYSKSKLTQDNNCHTEGMPTLLVGGPITANAIPWEGPKPSAEEVCPLQQRTREVVTWELAQKYFIDPTFGGALVAGHPNVFTTTLELTGIAFLTQPRRLSPLISRLRVQNSDHTDMEWDLDYDFKQRRINTSTALLNFRFGQFTLGGGDAFLQVATGTQATGSGAAPPAAPSSSAFEQSFNQFRVVLGYGHMGKRGFSGATNIGFDANLNALQYGSIQTAYNWDCCGFDIEYRRFALGSVRNENQFRFTFALANIGAFGNLKRQERLF